MKKVNARTNQGYEIVCYYPKENGRYTANTGNVMCVYQTDDVTEVAAWFAHNSWCSCYGNSDYAEPSTYFNGSRWPRNSEALNIVDCTQ